MTTSAETPIIVYTLTGTNLGPFSIPFTFETAADIQARLNNGVGGMNQGPDFSVTAADPLDAGGTLTLHSSVMPSGGWAAATQLAIWRQTGRDQPSAFGDVTGFSPDQMEAALDHISRQVQDAFAIANRAMLMPAGETAPILPAKATRAGKALVWSGDGGSIVSYDVSVLGDTTLVWNDGSVSNTKLANMTAPALKGRSTTGTGSPEDLAPATVRGMLALTSNINDVIADGGIVTAKLADAGVTNAKLAAMAAGTVKGNASGSSGPPTDIAISSLITGGLALDDVASLQSSPTSVAAAEFMDLSASGFFVAMTGGGGKTKGFGNVAAGHTRLIYNLGAAQGMSNETSQLDTAPVGGNFWLGPGMAMLVKSQGAGNWKAIWKSSPIQMFDVFDAGGAGPNKYALGLDATTGYPDFMVDQSKARAKTLMKSVIFGDPGDTVDIGSVCADGTPASPSYRTAGYPGAFFLYSQPIDTTGAWNGAATFSSDPSGICNIGRSAELYMPMWETPTPTARGGGVVIEATALGKQTPFQSIVAHPNGGVMVGMSRGLQAAIANGGGLFQGGTAAAYPWTGSLYTAPGRGTMPLAGWGFYDYVPAGALDVCMPPFGNASTIAMRRYNDPTQGFDLMDIPTDDALYFATVNAAARTAVWALDRATGCLRPKNPAGVDVGRSDVPWNHIYSSQHVINSTRDWDHDVITPTNVSFSSSGMSIAVSRAASSSYNFYKFTANGVTQAHMTGDGNGHCAGAFTGGGGGFAEYFEWADGNPDKEDRAGWPVVLEGKRIRKATADDTDDAIIGVISHRPCVIGNAAQLHWSKAFATDEWGRRQYDQAEAVEWEETIEERTPVKRHRKVKVMRERPKTEPVLHHGRRVHHEMVDGKLVRRVHLETTTHHKAVTQVLPVHDEAGQPITVTEKVERRGKKGQLLGHDEVTRQLSHEYLVMEPVEVDELEEYDDVEVTTRKRHHSYLSHQVPEGVTVPPDATRSVIEIPRMHPQFDAAAPYANRQDRPEWDVVSLLGQELVRPEAPKPARWLKMDAPAQGPELWLVRP